jgi:uncharacterized protein (DUF1778 family)
MSGPTALIAELRGHAAALQTLGQFAVLQGLLERAADELEAQLVIPLGTEDAVALIRELKAKLRADMGLEAAS